MTENVFYAVPPCIRLRKTYGGQVETPARAIQQFNILKRKCPNAWMSIHNDGSNQSFSVLFENETSAFMNHSTHCLSNIGCTR